MDLSIVIPLFNERDNLRPLHDELVRVLAPLGRAYEIVFVDDGSTDGGLDVLREIKAQDEHVRVLSLAKNSGQTAALACGFKSALGEIVIALDADGENDPADIPRLLAELDRGYDLVSGWRTERWRDAPGTRRLPSVCANALISRLTGVRLHDYGCTFKVYRRWVSQRLLLYGEMHRFIPAIAAELGARIVKTYWCEGFEKVVNGCPVPVVIAGGPKVDTELEVFNFVHDGMEKGAIGVNLGRNIWQHDYPVAMVKALRAIIHEKANPKQAHDIFRKDREKTLKAQA